MGPILPFRSQDTVSAYCRAFCSFTLLDLTNASTRLVCGLFALDTSFMIFYNMPPHMFTEELKVDMPCSLQCYIADDAEACRNAAMTELGSRRPRMNDLFASYCGDELELHTDFNQTSFSVLDFYVIILGMYEP